VNRRFAAKSLRTYTARFLLEDDLSDAKPTDTKSNQIIITIIIVIIIIIIIIIISYCTYYKLKIDAFQKSKTGETN